MKLYSRTPVQGFVRNQQAEAAQRAWQKVRAWVNKHGYLEPSELRESPVQPGIDGAPEINDLYNTLADALEEADEGEG